MLVVLFCCTRARQAIGLVHCDTLAATRRRHPREGTSRPLHPDCQAVADREQLVQLCDKAKGNYTALASLLSEYLSPLITPKFQAGCEFVQLAAGATARPQLARPSVLQELQPQGQRPARRLAANILVDPYRRRSSDAASAHRAPHRIPLDSGRSASRIRLHRVPTATNAVRDAHADAARPSGRLPEHATADVAAGGARANTFVSGDDGAAMDAVRGSVATATQPLSVADVATATAELDLAVAAAARDLPRAAAHPAATAGAPRPRVAVVFSQDCPERLAHHLTTYSAHLATHLHYALYHGYDVLLYTRRDAMPFNMTGHFSKIPAAYGTLFGLDYDFVLGTDWDSFIDPLAMAPLPALAAAWPEAGVLLQAEANLCSGVVLFRRGAAAGRALAQWWAMGATGMFAGRRHDQAALKTNMFQCAPAASFGLAVFLQLRQRVYLLVECTCLWAYGQRAVLARARSPVCSLQLAVLASATVPMRCSPMRRYLAQLTGSSDFWKPEHMPQPGRWSNEPPDPPLQALRERKAQLQRSSEYGFVGLDDEHRFDQVLLATSLRRVSKAAIAM
jgi:hypothetical protein